MSEDSEPNIVTPEDAKQFARTYAEAFVASSKAGKPRYRAEAAYWAGQAGLNLDDLLREVQQTPARDLGTEHHDTGIFMGPGTPEGGFRGGVPSDFQPAPGQAPLPFTPPNAVGVQRRILPVSTDFLPTETPSPAPLPANTGDNASPVNPPTTGDDPYRSFKDAFRQEYGRDITQDELNDNKTLDKDLGISNELFSLLPLARQAGFDAQRLGTLSNKDLGALIKDNPHVLGDLDTARLRLFPNDFLQDTVLPFLDERNPAGATDLRAAANIPEPAAPSTPSTPSSVPPEASPAPNAPGVPAGGVSGPVPPGALPRFGGGGGFGLPRLKNENFPAVSAQDPLGIYLGLAGIGGQYGAESGQLPQTQPVSGQHRSGLPQILGDPTRRLSGGTTGLLAGGPNPAPVEGGPDDFPPIGWQQEVGADGKIYWSHRVTGEWFDPRNNTDMQGNPMQRPTNPPAGIGLQRTIVGTDHFGNPIYQERADPNYIDPMEQERLDHMRAAGGSVTHVNINATPGADELNQAKAALAAAQAALDQAKIEGNARTIAVAEGHLAETKRQFDITTARNQALLPLKEADITGYYQGLPTLARETAVGGAERANASVLAERASTAANIALRMADQAEQRGEFAAAQALRERAQAFGEGIQAAGLTGTYNGTTTLAGRQAALAEQQAAFARAKDPYSAAEKLGLLRYGAPSVAANDSGQLSGASSVQPLNQQMLAGTPGSSISSPVDEGIMAGAAPGTLAPPRRLPPQALPPGEGTIVQGTSLGDTDGETLGMQRMPAATLQPMIGQRRMGLPATLASAAPSPSAVPGGSGLPNLLAGGKLTGFHSTLPVLSAQDANSMFPSERATWDAALLASGTNPEDYYTQQRRLTATAAPPRATMRRPMPVIRGA